MSNEDSEEFDVLYQRDLRGLSTAELRAVTEALYKRDADKIFRYGVGYFHGDEEASAELVQRVFEQVVDSLSGFRGEATLSTWVMRIAMRTAWRQRSGRRAILELKEETLVAKSESGASRLIKNERDQQVNEALLGLKAEHRSVLVLFAIEGLSHQEVADVLGTEVGTAWSRLARARIALARELRDL